MLENCFPGFSLVFRPRYREARYADVGTEAYFFFCRGRDAHVPMWMLDISEKSAQQISLRYISFCRFSVRKAYKVIFDSSSTAPNLPPQVNLFANIAKIRRNVQLSVIMVITSESPFSDLRKRCF